MVKIIGITYTKGNFKWVADNTTQMNDKEKTQLLRLLKYFEDLFDGTLGEWDTEPVDPELNPNYKSLIVNIIWYPELTIRTFAAR